MYARGISLLHQLRYHQFPEGTKQLNTITHVSALPPRGGAVLRSRHSALCYITTFEAVMERQYFARHGNRTRDPLPGSHNCDYSTNDAVNFSEVTEGIATTSPLANLPNLRFSNFPTISNSQKAGNAFVPPLVFRVSMGGGDCLPSRDPSARLPALEHKKEAGNAPVTRLVFWVSTAGADRLPSDDTDAQPGSFKIDNLHLASVVINARTFSVREEAFGQEWEDNHRMTSPALGEARECQTLTD
uniref:SFRICE_022935 n=1 Tax=Spodoptera frugiperda TaxID=7108 RepID=A0A2H1X2M9_SPOFR